LPWKHEVEGELGIEWETCIQRTTQSDKGDKGNSDKGDNK